MPKKNLILFAVTTALLLASWYVVRNYVLEQPAPPDAGLAQKKEAKDTAKAKEPEKPQETAKAKEQEPPKTETPAVKDPKKGPTEPPKPAPAEPLLDFALGDPKMPEYFV